MSRNESVKIFVVLVKSMMLSSKRKWIKKIKNLNSAMTTRIHFYPIKN